MALAALALVVFGAYDSYPKYLVFETLFKVRFLSILSHFLPAETGRHVENTLKINEPIMRVVVTDGVDIALVNKCVLIVKISNNKVEEKTLADVSWLIRSDFSFGWR